MNKDDSKKYSVGSHKKVDFKCVECEFEKKMDISTFMAQGISCPVCGDGVSYPTKVMTNMLLQINVPFIQEVGINTLYWSENFRYDFYIPSINCIIEAHGGQHYSGGFVTLGGKEYDEEGANDVAKKELALKNGVSHYFEIDCRESTIPYIKNSIILSGLLKIFNIKEEFIDWELIGQQSAKSKLILACDMWNKHKDMALIEKELYISRSTLSRYLKNGTEIGLCNYDGKEVQDMSLKSRRKGVKVFKDGVLLGVYKSMIYAEKVSEKEFGMKFKKPQ